MLFVNLAFCFHILNLIFVQFFLTSLLFFDKVMAFLELSIVVFLFFFSNFFAVFYNHPPLFCILSHAAVQ